MLNRLKKFFGVGETHKIVGCETKPLQDDGETKYAIFLAANLYDATALDALINDLVELFKVHRMISPPETSLLLVTVIGPCKVSDVARRWRKRAAGDQIAMVWMNQMEKADIGVSPRNLVAQSFESILPDTTP